MTTIPQGSNTPTTTAEADGILDLHELYQQQTAAGYTRSLTLFPHEAQNVATRLRGIGAIARVLTAATDSESFTLGAYIEAGLLDAIRALTDDAHHTLEHADERARQQGGAA